MLSQGYGFWCYLQACLGGKKILVGYFSSSKKECRISGQLGLCIELSIISPFFAIFSFFLLSADTSGL